jgi:hypothetical protein
MKRNGFGCPLHWQQILTWFIFSSNIICFYIFTSPLLIRDNKSSLQIIFALLSALVAFICVIATLNDPTDKLLKKELKKREICNAENIRYVLEISKELDFCVICCSNIDSSSKHCKICNRCVNNFDHHCNWLNNCIGQQNYCHFLFLLFTVWVNTLYNTIIMLYAFVIFVNRDKDEDLAIMKNASSLGIGGLSCPVVSFIFAVIDFGIWGNISYLIIINIWLRAQGMTTYEYIIKYLNKEEKNDKKDSNDNSENVILRINPNLKKTYEKNIPSEQGTRKGRNKFIPEELVKKIKEVNSEKLNIVNNSDKIIIHDKDYQKKIFKPIVDKIYTNSNNIENYKNNLNYVSTPETKNYNLKTFSINNKVIETDRAGSINNNNICSLPNFSNLNTVPVPSVERNTVYDIQS